MPEECLNTIKQEPLQEFRTSDKLSERARKIAEVALADIFNNQTKVDMILPRAILRVQEVLEMYEKLDGNRNP